MYKIESKENLTPAEAALVKAANRRDRIKNLIILFLVIMLVLTFFSNTIMNYSLPEVAVQFVEEGDIAPVVRGTGTAEVENPYNVSIASGRTVNSVEVQPGDMVEKGDVLFKLDDTESEELKTAKQELATAKADYQKTLFGGDLSDSDITRIRNGEWRDEDTMQAQLADVNERYKAAKSDADYWERRVNALSGNASSSSGSSDDDDDGDSVGLGNAPLRMPPSGGAPAMGVSGSLPPRIMAEDSGSGSSELDRANYEKSYADGVLASVTAEKEALEKSIAAEIELKQKKAAIDAAQAKVDRLSGSADGGEVKSPVAGKVVTVAYTAGETTNEETDAAVIQVEGRDLIVSFSTGKEQAAALTPGTEAKPQYAWNYTDFKAKLKSISKDKDDANKRVLTFVVDSSEVEAGDSVALMISQNAQHYDTTVPVSAVHEDNSGKFIYIVEARQSPLGNRYIARKVPVTVEASDESMCAINGSLSGSEYVITTASKPVAAGKQVRLTEDSDAS
ncbi:MAG: biotin/lipoyl-binding protein [Lachnospiraceae bacterium]|jgi:multidrug efflux pump subunit AcrA (membrane-fusion protein)|nr:biotin/lipoyl-binding protein [Lachnospiraceae bacterium]